MVHIFFDLVNIRNKFLYNLGDHQDLLQDYHI